MEAEYMDEQQFRDKPRDYAMGMVEEGFVSPSTMIVALLKYMSHDDVREALDINEMSPRFYPVSGQTQEEKVRIIALAREMAKDDGLEWSEMEDSDHDRYVDRAELA